MVAEFCITIFIGGFAMGLYFAFSGTFDDKANLNRDELVMKGAPIMIGVFIVGMLVMWFTFYRAKFSKFTLGNIIPKRKWKAFLFFTLPLLGFTMLTDGLLSLLGIDITIHNHNLPNEWFYNIPVWLTGSFMSAYILYGAIYEELAKNGKKTWVIFLTIFLMTNIPFCLSSVRETVTWIVPVFILGTIQEVYEFWVYQKTRSTILLFLMNLVVEAIPAYYTNNLVCIALCGVGGAFLLGGYTYLTKEYKADLKPSIPTEPAKG